MSAALRPAALRFFVLVAFFPAALRLRVSAAFPLAKRRIAVDRIALFQKQLISVHSNLRFSCVQIEVLSDSKLLGFLEQAEFTSDDHFKTPAMFDSERNRLWETSKLDHDIWTPKEGGVS